MYDAEAASSLREKYISKTLDLLPENQTVLKVRDAIICHIENNECTQITQQRHAKVKGQIATITKKIPSGAVWTCAVCNKQNEESCRLCSVCGRKKRSRQEEKASAPLKYTTINKTIQKNNSSNDSIQDFPVSSTRNTGTKDHLHELKEAEKENVDERKRSLYLKKKSDYEVDARQELATDIMDALKSVRGTFNSEQEEHKCKN